ncbi:MAG: entry exclusion 1 domain-containing protein [Micavibrio aeruginosavorus]|uniref:Entry exclusion 1 domain-containing protein n=1 Tax=Micavibrio aeruginosavorus TaxID=349221 RepID=A0A7T5R3I7_9BACT|nr:MAG: entry exclusion 1 domain-containing protein [Micavibrio aeruginosavorus]
MAKVGPQRAAELTGRSKSTVQRAMKAGKLSYEIDNAGRRVIDVSELERVFGLAPQGGEVAASANIESELEKAANIIETERMKMRIRMLEDQLEIAQEQIEDLKNQRDQWQKQAQQVLLTSQYSQKQAEELKEELKERDRRAQMRRQMEMQRRGVAKPTAAAKAADVPVPEKGSEPRKASPFSRPRQAAAEAARNFDIQGLWHKIRGESVANNAQPQEEKISA